MSNVVESIPEPFRATLVEVIGAQDPMLLSSLRARQSPSPEQKEAVEKALLDQFFNELGPNDEPTEKGRRADAALAAFYEQWPNDAE
jgi:hypothetical protein